MDGGVARQRQVRQGAYCPRCELVHLLLTLNTSLAEIEGFMPVVQLLCDISH